MVTRFDPASILDTLRQGAPRRAPTIRTLASFAGHTDCHLASLGFAAEVDFDRLLVGTTYEAPFGQSPFAFSRGLAFQRIVAENGYAAILQLLRQELGFAIDEVAIANLRDGYPQNHEGMRLRAHETRSLVGQIVRSDSAAPNLIDGAVFATEISGIRAYFEADAVAARFSSPIHVGEIKSFPIVDGRTDPEKLGQALDQVSIYILLARSLVVQLRGAADLVTHRAVLIAPQGVGLRPTLAVKDVSRRIERIERLLARVPVIADLAPLVPQDASFSLIADPGAEEAKRIDTLNDLADRVGTRYVPGCLSTCGLARLCRERTFRNGSPDLAGPEVVRLLPGVSSLGRAADLADGAPPGPSERTIAPQLARAARLYDAHLRDGQPRLAVGGSA